MHVWLKFRRDEIFIVQPMFATPAHLWAADISLRWSFELVPDDKIYKYFATTWLKKYAQLKRKYHGPRTQRQSRTRRRRQSWDRLRLCPGAGARGRGGLSVLTRSVAGIATGAEDSRGNTRR